MITAAIVIIFIWLLVLTIALGALITDISDTREQLWKCFDTMNRIIESRFKGKDNAL